VWLDIKSFISLQKPQNTTKHQEKNPKILGILGWK